MDSRQETGTKAEKGEDRKGQHNRTRKNNNSSDRKMESNDIPEILDRGEREETSEAV